MLRYIPIIGALVAIVGGYHYYLWIRLVRDAALSVSLTRVLTVLVVALAVNVPLAMIFLRILPSRVAIPFVWVAYVWIGVSFMLFVTLLPTEIIRLVARFGAGSPPDADRRQFIGRAIAGGVGAIGAVASVVAVREGLGPVAIKRVQVALSRWRREGTYVIAQLSDIHIGPTIRREFLERIVRQVNDQKPDLIVITGDLVDGSVEDLATHVEPLRDLKAPDGVYFVTGNHERYSNAEAWVQFLPTLGVKVLENARVAIGGETGFDLAGIHDPEVSGRRDQTRDVEIALEGRDVARPVVLLAHRPKAVLVASKQGVDLQLSGHTHGGQIFPFNFLVKLSEPYVAGLAKHADTMLYVSSGTGHWGPPMRLRAPAEITRLEVSARG